MLLVRSPGQQTRRRRVNLTHLLLCEISGGSENWVSEKSEGERSCKSEFGRKPINDNAPMTIVFSFSSSCMVSMDGIVPDMARGLVMPDIVTRGEGAIKKGGGKV